ncbi:MAG: 2-oxoacid:ferredoxin oxidoreductase subunit beta, partial [Candidatus Bathyarchaeota archaeon]|nr:2-oxoacid:ferredoxin oxidoreductase subunit beta [Candidatus Bathyarchaeota archaeon]
FDPIVHNAEEETQKKIAAIAKSYEWNERISIGVFYQNELEPTFEERISKRIPFYLQNPPAKQKISDENGKPSVHLKTLLEELKTS